MDTFAVIGLGRFGYRLATLLAEGGAEVIAIDRKRGLVEAIRDSVTVAVCLDSTDEQALLAQGVDRPTDQKEVSPKRRRHPPQGCRRGR